MNLRFFGNASTGGCNGICCVSESAFGAGGETAREWIAAEFCEVSSSFCSGVHFALAWALEAQEQQLYCARSSEASVQLWLASLEPKVSAKRQRLLCLICYWPSAMLCSER